MQLDKLVSVYVTEYSLYCIYLLKYADNVVSVYNVYTHCTSIYSLLVHVHVLQSNILLHCRLLQWLLGWLFEDVEYILYISLCRQFSRTAQSQETSSALVVGFTSRRIYSLSSCHRFSMGFMSGDSAGVFHQLTSCSWKNAWALRDACSGSLSCINLCCSG